MWIVAHACGLKFYSDSIYYDLLGYNWRQLVENDDFIMHIAQNLQVCMCTVKFKQLGDKGVHYGDADTIFRFYSNKN